MAVSSTKPASQAASAKSSGLSRENAPSTPKAAPTVSNTDSPSVPKDSVGLSSEARETSGGTPAPSAPVRSALQEAGVFPSQDSAPNTPLSVNERPDFGTGRLPTVEGGTTAPGLGSFLGQPGELGPLPSFTMPSFETIRGNVTASQAQSADARTPIDPNAEVAVLDNFFPSFGQQGPSHGESVSNVLRESGQLDASDIQQMETHTPFGMPTALLTAPGEAGSRERLDSFIELTTTGLLQNTNGHLASIAEDPNSNIRTINQSQGINPANQLKLLQDMSFQTGQDGNMELTEAGRVVFDGLGIPPEVSRENLRAFIETGAARIADIHESSPLVQQALERHSELSQTLADQGVSYVVSAGNQGGLARDFTSAGLTLPDGYQDNLLTNPHNISVGATDNSATLDPRDDSVAGFNSADPDTDFLADGVGVRVGPGSDDVADGTSFSAPFVAGRLDTLRVQNPSLPTDQLTQLLADQHSTRILGSELPVIQ